MIASAEPAGGGSDSDRQMLARSAFDQDAAAAAAVSHARLLRTVGRLPHRQFHGLVRAAAWAETWLRWPLRTLRMLDSVDETLARVDPDGAQFGLTQEVRSRFRRNLLYDGMADIAVLISRVDDPKFRRQAVTVEGREGLEREIAAGPGAIVLGFRLGAYSAIPMVLGALGYKVAMIVGAEHVARSGQDLGEQFAPAANSRIKYFNAQDSRVLAQSLEALNEGRVVSTLMELSPIKYAKTTPVQFL
ncbi:MAG TPA: hypothetical protein VLS25_10315, partial [Dehalococcoidia bacterium]|nr:hypothetical protein [Dehalococcoidia bacterium]